MICRVGIKGAVVVTPVTLLSTNPSYIRLLVNLGQYPRGCDQFSVKLQDHRQENIFMQRRLEFYLTVKIIIANILCRYGKTKGFDVSS